MVNIGDKVVITKLNGEELESPRIVTVSYVGNTWFEIHEIINGDNLVLKDSSVDDWSIAESSDSVFDKERLSSGTNIIVTRVNGIKLMRPRKVSIVDVSIPIIEIYPEVNGESLLHVGAQAMDDWYIVEDVKEEESNLPEVGDRIIVTRLNGDDLYEPALVESSESDGLIKVYLTDLLETEYIQVSGEYTDEWFNEEDLEEIEETPKVGQLVKVDSGGSTDYGEVVETDVTEAGEYEFKVKTSESSKSYKLNQVDSIETYKGDEDKIMPNYIELASGGMTFSEFAGEDITEESLNFRPYDDKVNHPSHYNRYSREVIESIKGLCTPDEFRGYLKGNIIKYSARYSGKDGIQDIDKLAKYTQFLKEFEIEQAELNEEE